VGSPNLSIHRYGLDLIRPFFLLNRFSDFPWLLSLILTQ
jgi:hypothetical protein